jgi:hypothetical protein
VEVEDELGGDIGFRRFELFGFWHFYHSVSGYNINMSNGENQGIRNFCDRFCTVREPIDSRFLTAEELRKVRQNRPRIRTIYGIDSRHGDRFRAALHNLEAINRMISLL